MDKRFVNLLVPLTLGKIVDSLATTNSNLGFFKAMADGAKGWLANADLWTLIFFYAGLKSLQGSGGLLTVIQVSFVNVHSSVKRDRRSEVTYLSFFWFFNNRTSLGYL